MNYELKSHLKTLVESHAPSGYESPIQAVVREAWTPFVSDFQQDGLGSLIGIKRATHPPVTPRRIMLAAHVDEIGMIVRDVIDGFILFNGLHGVDNRVMPAQSVRVHGRESLRGIVATKPPHLLTEAEKRKYPDWDHLMIDVGLPAARVAELVRVGDIITVDVPMVELLGRKLAAKAFDNRASVAAVTHALFLLQSMTHTWDVYAAATTQEEVGLRGAATAAHHIAPDIAIALDVTFGTQPGNNGSDTYELGSGATLSMGPNFHPKLFAAIKQSAQALEMTISEEVLTGNSGTDAWAIQVAQVGIPTALIGIPLRNMHSPVETLDLRDIERAGRLLAHFIATLDADFLATLDWQRPTPQEATV
ncbi:MAG: M20/M25/M40 family metallo-hydrolase [Phototrophicaceae bacterium]|jgi:endoglucanase